MKYSRNLLAVILMLTIALSVVLMGNGNISAAETPILPTGATGLDLVNVAKGEIGVSGRPNKYTKAYGYINGSLSYDWCHVFVVWCGNQIGAKDIIPQTASCGSGVNFFTNRGEFQPFGNGYIPCAGDLIYFNKGHVGIVSECKNGYVYTVEGNCNDTVIATSHLLSDTGIRGYGTPKYSAAISPLNLGENFYAVIYNQTSNYAVVNDQDNVVLGTNNKKLRKAIWNFKRQDDKSYMITSYLDGKALDVTNGANINYANLQVYNSNNSDAQRWYIISHPSGGFSLMPKCAMGKVMDITDGLINTEGTNIQLYTINTHPAQQFAILDFVNPEMYLSNDLGDSFYATITNSQGIVENTENVLSFGTESHNPNQIWHFEIQSGLNYKISSLYDNTVLGILDSTQVSTLENNDSDAQRWYLSSTVTGDYSLVSKQASGLALTTTENGFQLQSAMDSSPQCFSVNIIEDLNAYLNTSVTLGDVDMDEKITIKDATAIQKALASIISLNSTQKISADTDADGKITIKDATMIQKFLASLVDRLG